MIAPRRAFRFSWSGHLQISLMAVGATALAKGLFARFTAVQIAVFFSFYTLERFALLLGTIRHALGAPFSSRAPGTPRPPDSKNIGAGK